MPLATHESTPAYKRIQEAILKQIDAGELRSGDAVASERELARIHGVSLMTARHALAGLERRGFVERRRGAGTFVAPPRIHFNTLMSYTEQMASRRLPVGSKVLTLKAVANEPEIAARLSLPSACRLLKLERVRQAGNEPFAIETCYMSAEEFPEMNRIRLERGSLFSILEDGHGIELAYADEEVDATLSDRRTAKLLGIGHDLPLLRIRQVICSTQGKPVMYVLGLYRGDRHTLHIRRFR